MDPDVALEELRRLVKANEVETDEAIRSDLAEDLATVFAGLDLWMSRGGSLPGPWAVQR